MGTIPTRKDKVTFSADVFALYERLRAVENEFMTHFEKLGLENESLMEFLEDRRVTFNELLNPLAKALREEALQAFINSPKDNRVTHLDLGEFSVTTPISKTVDVRQFYRLLWNRAGGQSLCQKALDDEVLEQVISIPKDGETRLEAWAAKNGLTAYLDQCKEEVALTPRVTSSSKIHQEIPPLGQHYKPKT